MPIFNIGTFIFGIIFVYMVITFVMYKTSSHITAYEVTSGAITGNYRFTALALKEEQIINASQSGTVSYYMREGSKVGSGSTVCTINEHGQTSSGDGSESGSASAAELSNMTADDLDVLQECMASYAMNYDPLLFQNVYNFKADVDSTLLEIANTQNSDLVVSSAGSYVNLCNAPASGFVVYAVDGYETLTEDQLTQEHFDQKNYSRSNLRLNTSVKSGDPIYKLITEETWALYLPLTQKMVTELSSQSTIRFRFLKDNITFSGPFSIVQGADGSYGRIELNNSLVRYASERYLEIELLLSKRTGLKIPNTAIVEKTFWEIPKEYALGNDSTTNEIYLIKESFGEDGSANVEKFNATVYDATDTCYYVDTGYFNQGDYVVMKDSAKRYQIQKSKTLQGVYNINKGYAIFREITIIDENEEFCIVESDSPFGLAQYDHIVLDASSVTDDDIVY